MHVYLNISVYTVIRCYIDFYSSLVPLISSSISSKIIFSLDLSLMLCFQHHKASEYVQMQFPQCQRCQIKS